MTAPTARDRTVQTPASGNEISLLSLGADLLRWRKRIVALALLCGAIGFTSAMLGRRTFTASATIVPQNAEGPTSGLAAAASQFGISVPSSNASWGPPVYVRLLSSPALLEQVLLDTLTVAEDGNRRMTLIDLLEVNDPTPALRREHGIRVMQLITSAQEVKPLNAVDVTVQTYWPSVSLQVVQKLVAAVNDFNVRRRRSQAGAERQFVDSVAGDAERNLRNAEDRLQSFMQTNRVYSSPELAFQRDRLQREVALRQQMYTSLLQSREDARIREVRSTPVVTVLEPPRLPAKPNSRKAALKTLLGLVIGVTIGILLALATQAFQRLRRTSNEESAEFLRMVDEATPRFLKRRRV